MKERIVYSPEQMLLDLDSSMKELNAFRYDRRFRSVFGDALVRKADEWEKTFRTHRDDPLTLVVVGDFKRGKSTLINAILGEEVVPANVTTETITLNRLSYGSSSNEAVLSGNRKVVLADEEITRDSLEKVFEELDAPVERLEIKRENEFLKKITIIDTPGTGDAMKDFSDLVKESLIQADAVIYVFNVQYPLSRTEQIFLKSAVLPQRYTKLFLVANFADIIPNEAELDRVRTFLTDKISGFIPNPNLYMVSALDELCRQIEEETIETPVTPILRGEFRKLRDDLTQLVSDKAESVIVSRMQRIVSAMTADFSDVLDAMESGLQMDDANKELAEAKLRHENSAAEQAAVIKQMRANVEAMKNEAMAWMGDFMERLSSACQNLEKETAEDLKKYLECYYVDLVQNAMNTCVEYHEDKIYELVSSVSEEIGSQFSDMLPEQKAYKFKIGLDNMIWTKGAFVGLFTSRFRIGSGLLSTVASVAADAVAGTMHSKEAQQRTPELISQLKQKLLAVNSDVSRAMEQQYKELSNSAEKLLMSYFGAKEEKEKYLLEQSLQVANANVEKKKEITELIREAHEILARVNASVCGPDEDAEDDTKKETGAI